MRLCTTVITTTITITTTIIIISTENGVSKWMLSVNEKTDALNYPHKNVVLKNFDIFHEVDNVSSLP